MGGKLRHLAIRSDNYAILGRFYQAAFGLNASSAGRPEGAISLSDGYVGFNFNPRNVGSWARLDHFGFEVDSVEEVEDRLREKYPQVQMLKRPSNRPFAGLTMHDPAGNYFDLSAASMENRRDVYAEPAKNIASRHVHHFMLRAIEPELISDFYRDVFDLEEQEKAADDPNFYLFDGQVTLVVTPWNISDYAGGTMGTVGPDHIGFAVEDLDKFEADLDFLKRRNPHLATREVNYGPEGETVLRLFETCHYGKRHFADPDGVLFDVIQA